MCKKKSKWFITAEDLFTYESNEAIDEMFRKNEEEDHKVWLELEKTNEEQYLQRQERGKSYIICRWCGVKFKFIPGTKLCPDCHWENYKSNLDMIDYVIDNVISSFSG